jgi:hypothetical protein
MTAQTRLREAVTHCVEALELLDWVEPPETLQALDLVTKGVEALASVLERMAAADESLTEISRALTASLRIGAEAISQALPTLAQQDECSAMWSDPTRQAPFRGVIGGHPLYVLLGSLGDIDPSRPAFLAAATVVAASKQLKVGARRGTNYASSIKGACDAARLTLKAAVAEQLPTDFTDITSYRRELVRISTELAAKDNELRHIDAIERLLRFLIKRTGGIRRGGAITREDELSRDETGDRPLQIERVNARTTQSVRTEARLSGLAEDELADDHEFVRLLSIDPDDSLDVDTPLTPDTGSVAPALAAQVMLRKNLVAQIERANQFLPVDLNRLSSPEVAALLHATRARLLDACLGPRSDSRPGSRRLDLEAVVGLVVCFWAGRLPAQAVRLRLYAVLEELPLHFPPRGLAFAMAEGLLVLPAIRPKAIPSYKNSDFSLAHATSDRVLLPLGSLLAPYLQRLPAAQRLRSANHPEGLASIDAFGEEAPRLVEAIQEVIRTVRHETGARLTPTRIARTLLSKLADLTGDLASATLACATPHRLADTAMQYLALPHSRLAGKFVACVQTLSSEVVSELQAAGESAREPKLLDPYEVTCHVGSPIRPQATTVRHLADALEQALGSARRNVLEIDYRIGLHNAFTRYVHFMLRFAIGLRDVGEPLPGWDRIHRTRRTIIVSDKNDVASYSSRLLPLPDLVLQQLEAWACHLVQLETHLAIEHVIIGRQKRHRDGLLYYLLRSKNSIRPARSNDPEVRQQLATVAPQFQLPLNCNRHYLRSILSELNCPAELMDAFMGHWVRGREPWGRFSALPPQVLVERLRPFVDEAFGTTGFRVVRGNL